MNEEHIVSRVVVRSQIAEEVSAFFSAIRDVEELFLHEQTDSSVDFRAYHSDLKRVYTQALKFYEDECAWHMTPPRDKFNAPKNTSFVPISVETFNSTGEKFAEVLPVPDYNKCSFGMASFSVPASAPHIQRINYPNSASVQFSFIDERQDLIQLIPKIMKQREIGLLAICHPRPLTLCALCISLRECEYLIDPAEIPTCVCDLAKVLADRRVVKVVHNAAETCFFLHLFGAKEINNVFCISTAAYTLGQDSSLMKLTSEFRKRMEEGWISSENETILKPRIASEKSENELVKMIRKYRENVKHDWRLRPFSFVQMQITRQQVHYLLYLYDSFRLKINSETNMLKNVLLISNQKANMDWRFHIFELYLPNSIILSSLYHQPLPDNMLFTRIMTLKTKFPILTDSLILWICLQVPKTIEELISIEKLAQQNQQMFEKTFVRLPKTLEQSILSIITNVINTKQLQRQTTLQKRHKSVDEIVTELGWFSEPKTAPIQRQSNFQIETTLSPKQIQSSNTPSSLLNLRDPEQPTSVSLQIPGIPQTEKCIYDFANNLRLIQKIKGKNKAKLIINKEENTQEETPEKAISKLVQIGYINETAAQKICIEKKHVPKFVHISAKKRSKSADKTRQTKQNYQRPRGLQR